MHITHAICSLYELQAIQLLSDGGLSCVLISQMMPAGTELSSAVFYLEDFDWLSESVL